MEKQTSFIKANMVLELKEAVSKQLWNLIGKILHGLNNKKVTLALFIDLSKAFDTLNHDILIKKTRKEWHSWNLLRLVNKLPFK